MKFPFLRIILTILLLLSLPVFSYTYETFKPQIEASAAVAQLEDSDVVYGASRRVIVDQFIPTAYYLGLTGSLLFIWGTWVFSNRKALFS